MHWSLCKQCVQPPSSDSDMHLSLCMQCAEPPSSDSGRVLQISCTARWSASPVYGRWYTYYDQFRCFHSIDLAKCCRMMSFSSQTDEISPHFDLPKVPLLCGQFRPSSIIRFSDECQETGHSFTSPSPSSSDLGVRAIWK